MKTIFQTTAVAAVAMTVSAGAAMATCINCPTSGGGSNDPINTPVNTSVQIGGAGQSTGDVKSAINMPEHVKNVTSTFEGYDKGTVDIAVGASLNGNLCSGGCEEGQVTGLVTAERNVGSLQVTGFDNFRGGTIEFGGSTFADAAARLDKATGRSTGDE